MPYQFNPLSGRIELAPSNAAIDGVAQTLTLVGTSLGISAGNTVDLSVIDTQAAAQDLDSVLNTGNATTLVAEVGGIKTDSIVGSIPGATISFGNILGGNQTNIDVQGELTVSKVWEFQQVQSTWLMVISRTLMETSLLQMVNSVVMVLD